MKSLLSITLCLLLLASCRKEAVHVSSDNYLAEVRRHLKDSLLPEDYSKLDFSHALVSGLPNDKQYFLRVPFVGKSIQNDFLTVRTSYTGEVREGKIVHIEGAASLKEGRPGNLEFNGRISMQSLKGKTLLSSPITKGFIEALHPTNILTREAIVPSQAPGMMPEVIVVAYVHTGVSWSTWMMVQSFFSDISGGGGSSSGFYWPMDPGSSGGGSGGGSAPGYYPPYYGDLGGWGTDDPLPGGSGLPQDELMNVDFETQDNLDAIDIQKFVNCFNTIPDAGAKCKIEIFSDIPVDGNPNRIFDFNSGSPGHTFLCISKENGTQRASQNIGFYPKTGWKNVLTDAPMDGKFVDNEQHEFNAGFKMNLTPAQLTSVLTELLYLKNQKYDIDNYNCTDWALDVFNKVRTNKLEIPLYDIPGNVPSTGTRTPQGLYNKLKTMFDSNDPEKANITIDIIKGWAGGSTGPCN